MTQTEPRTPELDLTVAGWSVGMITSPEFATDPRPFFAQLRQAGAPLRDDVDAAERSSSILVTRYQDVEQTLRNPKSFSSDFGQGMAGIGNERPLIPLQIDPPHHKKYRVLLDPWLAPRRVARLEQEVAQLVNQMIDSFAQRGSCEFVEELAIPLPCTVFLRLLGLPLDDLDLFLGIKDGIVRGDNEPTFEKAQEARIAAGQKCYDYFETALDRIAGDQTPGLLLDLLNAEIDGMRLTRDEIMDICYLFIIAGLDTVTDSLCCFWNHLATHPEHRQMIVDDPSLIPSAVEELLRWESPVSTVARTAAEDTEINGCPVRKGDSLLVLVGAANTDPDGVAGADEVDFQREANRHFAFGGGIHRCLGSHLARLELRVVMREWHRRIPHYSIAEGCDLVWTPMLRACAELPLIFTA